jgi:hypothetical protein
MVPMAKKWILTVSLIFGILILLYGVWGMLDQIDLNSVPSYHPYRVAQRIEQAFEGSKKDSKNRNTISFSYTFSALTVIFVCSGCVLIVGSFLYLMKSEPRNVRHRHPRRPHKS